MPIVSPAARLRRRRTAPTGCTGAGAGVALLLVLGLSSSPTTARARPVLPLRVLVRVARCEGRAVRPSKWVEGHIASARRLFARYGIDLRARVESFAPPRCVLLTRAQRHSLAPHARADLPTVLVVQRVRDLDLPSYNLMGVHWRYAGRDPALEGRRWVYLTARAKPPVLAHELGHYLGLPHDPAGGNLMAPGPSDPLQRGSGSKPKPWAPRLTSAQVRRVRRAVRRLVRTTAGTGRR